MCAHAAAKLQTDSIIIMLSQLKHVKEFSLCICDAVGLWAESHERFFLVYM